MPAQYGSGSHSTTTRLYEDDGRDLRDEPIEERKAKLARPLVDCQPALALNRVFDDQGVVIFEHACKLGRLRMLAAH